MDFPSPPLVSLKCWSRIIERRRDRRTDAIGKNLIRMQLCFSSLKFSDAVLKLYSVKFQVTFLRIVQRP